MKLRSCFVAFILLFLTLAVSPVSFKTQARPAFQAGDEPPHSRRVYGPPDLSNPPAPISGLSEFQAQAGNLAWTALVFQLYTDSGWNIAYQPRDSNQVYLLTDDSAPDITPRLSHDGTQVAFASNNDKYFRIILLNLMSGERRVLTEQLGDATSPSWSPDGGRLVFEWERDGNSDVWVMNADGSGLTQLTFDGDYDGMPAWSPDGGRVAFISRRTGGYRVFVMSADGSNQLMYSNLPYSGDPAWSPDGKTIAFDADSNGDGWLGLWKIGADMANQSLIDEPSSATNIDFLMGSWSPDGTSVAYSNVHWIQINSDWYIEASQILWVNASNYSFYGSLAGFDTAMYPDWLTMDHLAPVSQVQPLPIFARPSQIVTWQGSDPGGSGIDHYDIQIRDTSGGSWQGWYANSVELFANLDKTGGHTYELRSRAQDVAFNLENWPANPDASVTLYNWMIHGQVRNNRGAPTINPDVQTSGSPFASQNDGLTGRYQIYAAASAASYTANWQKTGYGSLPQTSFSNQVDVSLDPVLPPADNLIANGDFETSSLAPWSTAGYTSLDHSGSSAFTGLNGAWIGESTPLPFNVPVESWAYDASLSTSTVIATDAQNRVHLAWAENYQFYYGVKRDGVWELGPLIIPDTYNSQGGSLHMQVTPGSVAHFTWARDQRIYYRRYDGAQWSAVETASDPNSATEVANLHLGWDGSVQIVYQNRYASFYARRTGNGQWTKEYLSNCNVGQQTLLFKDQNNIVHVQCGSNYAWRDQGGTWTTEQNPAGNALLDMIVLDDGSVYAIGKWNDDSLNFAYRLPGVGWSPIEITRNSWVRSALLGVGPDRQPRVVASFNFDGDYYFYFTRKGKNDWSVPVEIPNLIYHEPIEFVVRPDGSDHIFGFYETTYLRHFPGGVWQTLQTLGIYFSSLDVLFDGQGQPLLFGSTQHDFTYAGPPISVAANSSLLTQTVTIPADIPSPTLSYLVDYSGAPSSASSSFRLSLDDGANQTKLNRLTDSTAGWIHQWHDLSAWAGQAVTLTFQVDSAAGYYQTHASLDDVSLGTAYPSLWVRGGGIRYVYPGEQVSFGLQAGAYSGPLAIQAVLTTTLPAGWNYLSASPAPDTTGSQLVWQLGDLAGGTDPIAIQLDLECQVGTPILSDLSIPIVIRSDLNEIDLEDNQATIPVLVAYPIFLPAVQR